MVQTKTRLSPRHEQAWRTVQVLAAAITDAAEEVLRAEDPPPVPDRTKEQRKEGLRRLLSYPDAATYMGVSRNTIKALVNAGAFTKVTLGNRVLFDKTELDAFIERSKL